MGEEGTVHIYSPTLRDVWLSLFFWNHADRPDGRLPNSVGTGAELDGQDLGPVPAFSPEIPEAIARITWKHIACDFRINQ
jgi:hypothetical protein